jgi:hypothetical protein
VVEAAEGLFEPTGDGDEAGVVAAASDDLDADGLVDAADARARSSPVGRWR